MSANIFFQIDLNNEQLPSVLGKRKFEDSFESDSYEIERYGQAISSGFFKQNIGHTVTVPKIIELEEGEIYEGKIYEGEIYEDKKDFYQSECNISVFVDDYDNYNNFDDFDDSTLDQYCEYYKLNRDLYKI